MDSNTTVLTLDELGENSPLHSLMRKAVESFGDAVVEMTPTGSYATIVVPVNISSGRFATVADGKALFPKDQLILGLTNGYKVQAPNEDAENLIREGLGLS